MIQTPKINPKAPNPKPYELKQARLSRLRLIQLHAVGDLRQSAGYYRLLSTDRFIGCSERTFGGDFVCLGL